MEIILFIIFNLLYLELIVILKAKLIKDNEVLKLKNKKNTFAFIIKSNLTFKEERCIVINTPFIGLYLDKNWNKYTTCIIINIFLIELNFWFRNVKDL
jgi:hypothetical protein